MCEGYRRYPVFIIKTKEGLDKRLLLAEVKVNPCAITLESYSPTLGATVSNHAVQSEQFKSCFWEAYLLGNPSEKAWNSTSRWLRHVLEVPDPQPALHEALLAVSVIQCGKLNGNVALLIEGRRLYTRALRLLREALNDAVSVQRDDTLAAAGLLILYEVRFNIDSLDLSDGWTALRLQCFNPRWLDFSHAWLDFASTATWSKTTVHSRFKDHSRICKVSDGRFYILREEIHLLMGFLQDDARPIATAIGHIERIGVVD